MGWILDFIVVFIVLLNISILVKARKALFASSVELPLLPNNLIVFSDDSRVSTWMQELQESGFDLLGQSALEPETDFLIFRHAQGHALCIIYFARQGKKFCYEFYFQPLGSKPVVVGCSEMPNILKDHIRDFYRISNGLGLSAAYSLIERKMLQKNLVVLPENLPEILTLMSDYMAKDAAAKTKAGLLVAVQELQRFQKVTFKGAFSIMLRFGLPTAFYFSFRDERRFVNKFMK